MEESLEKAIEILKLKVEEKAKELNEAKKAVNQFCACIGEEPVYEISGDIGGLATNFKGHEYYMKPAATVIADILERSGESGGPLTVKEIYERMKAGGYKFDTKTDVNAMRGLRQSITKNSYKFHKLPNGKIGLTKWYPELKVKKLDAGTKPETGKRGRGRPRKEQPQETANEQNQSEGTEAKEGNGNQ